MKKSWLKLKVKINRLFGNNTNIYINIQISNNIFDKTYNKANLMMEILKK